MKHEPMKHQREGHRRLEGRRAFGLFFEQGCGKTYTALADFERLYAQGIVNAMLVLAPKGVHTNWILKEIPEHLEGNIIARAWTRSGGVRMRRHIEAVLKPRQMGEIEPMRVLAMNYDALQSKDAFELAKRFLQSTNCVIIADESQKLKNPAAARSKKALELRAFAKAARVLSGTPIANAPMDIFNQMEFLESGLLGTTSFRAFTAEYADLLDNDDPMKRRLIEKTPRVAHAQMIRRDENGNPIYKNLRKLQALIEKHSYRVLKKDCLDLPDKIRQTVFFELEPKQRAVYDMLKKKLRFFLEDGEEVTVDKLPAIMKLKQVTSGFIMPPDGSDPQKVANPNPRLDALREILEDTEGQMIIWAIYREEHDQIAALLKEMKITFGMYRGGVSDEERTRVKDEFQAGNLRVFLGNAASAGTGLTLTAATTAIYYSCDYNVDNRKQSEDRCHRIGTKKNVLYIDIVAEDTVDVAIASALARKMKIADQILGDFRAPETEQPQESENPNPFAAEQEQQDQYKAAKGRRESTRSAPVEQLDLAPTDTPDWLIAAAERDARR